MRRLGFLLRLLPIREELFYLYVALVSVRAQLDKLAGMLEHCEATEQDFPLVIKVPQLGTVLSVVNRVRSVLDKLSA